MEFRVLGSLEVVDDGSVLDLGPRKQRSLLALLLIHANRVVATDRILEDLWGDDAEGKENALWVYVSRLRSALEPGRADRGESSVLLTRDHGYMLAVAPGSVDARVFEDMAIAGRSLLRDDPPAAARNLGEALALWRGAPYEDFVYDEFAQAEIARLEEMRLTALQDRIEADLRRGLAGELIGELEALHDEHPLRERPVAQLMLALYRAGRQADALRTFERFRRGVGEELGIEPSPELRRLEEQVLLHDSRIQTRRPARDGARAGARASGANPFKGLRAFREEDGADFFGRDRLIAAIVRRLERGDPLVGLVGPSGSGKSSLVKAGIIPALRKGAIPGSDRWLIAEMVPGSHPFAELEAALLRSSLDAPDSLSEQLSDPEMGLLRAVLRVVPAEDAKLLLVVDQLEELFTLVDDEGERRRFLDALLPALDDPHGRVMVLLTLRADFYDRPLAYPEFGARLGDGVVNVVPLSPDELEEAAQKPAERAGVSLEPALLAALLTDVVGQSGALPAFQYALTELFDRRVGDTLTLDAYRAMGGVQGALTRRAEDLFIELDPDQQSAAKQLFLRLVTITDGDDWGRRRVPASEIVSLDVDVVAVQGVIESFARHRLLTLDRDLVTGSPTIEVAHEALLTQWDRLREWIEDGREDVRRHAALTSAMNEWNEAGRDPDFLLAGARLEGYEQWAATAVMGLSAGEQAYLEASTRVREQTRRLEAERAAQERKTARSARRRFWGLAAAIVVLAAVAAALLAAALAPEPPTIALLGFDREVGSIDSQALNGLEQAERDLDFRAEVLRPISDPGVETEAFLRTGPDLVIAGEVAASSLLGLDMAELTSRFPDVWFGLLGAPFGEVDLPNVTHAVFRSEQGSFLAGVAAALTTRTGAVGFIGGPPASIDRFRAGFEAGVHYARPDVEILSRYLAANLNDAFNDPLLAEVAARDLFTQGADVIFHAAGGSGRGIFTAADAMSDQAVQRWGIGADVDEFTVVAGPAREHVLTSMLKRHDHAVRALIERFLDGTIEPGVIELGLAEQAFDYSTSGGFLAEETIAAMEEARQGIITGAIAVPTLVDGPETAPPPADAEAEFLFDGQRCDLSGPDDGLAVGDVLRVSMQNLASAPVGVTAWQLLPDTTSRVLQASVPWEHSAGGPITGAEVRAGGTHGTSIVLQAPGPWVLTCFDGDEFSYTPIFQVAAFDAALAAADATTLGVSFDGEDCAYDGPDEITAGPVRLVFHNEATPGTFLDFVRLEEGKTFQDIIEYVEGDNPVVKPTWAHRVALFDRVAPGSSPQVVRTVEPGVHALVCGTNIDPAMYYGGSLTVVP